MLKFGRARGAGAEATGMGFCPENSDEKSWYGWFGATFRQGSSGCQGVPGLLGDTAQAWRFFFFLWGGA